MDEFKVCLHKNAFLIDWLTVSSKIDSFLSWVLKLGLSELNFEKVPGSRLKYQYRMRFQHILIHCTDSDFDGEKKYNEGSCLELSGQGCRELESFGSVSLDSLLEDLCESENDGYHITRIDLAYDDFTGVLPIETIYHQAENLEFTSRMPAIEIVRSASTLDRSRFGCSVMHGCRSSACMLRIYDKRVERGRFELKHWIRAELQLRAPLAQTVADKLLVWKVGKVFADVLRHYVQYRDVRDSERDHSHYYELPLAPWYAAFVEGAECYQRMIEKKKIEYNKSRMDSYAYDQNHNHTYTEILADGLIKYLETLLSFSDNLPEKYKKVLSELSAARSAAGSAPAFPFEKLRLHDMLDLIRDDLESYYSGRVDLHKPKK